MLYERYICSRIIGLPTYDIIDIATPNYKTPVPKFKNKVVRDLQKFTCSGFGSKIFFLSMFFSTSGTLLDNLGTTNIRSTISLISNEFCMRLPVHNLRQCYKILWYTVTCSRTAGFPTDELINIATHNY